MEKNLGHATAYGYAKSKGYSGTEEEFAQLMADYASVGQSAAQSAEQATASATSASGSAATATQAAQTATSKASEAVTAADTATTKASEASTSAGTASTAAQTATDKASEATTAATTATAKASEAGESAATATTAKTDAETARDAAAQSASEAAASAASIDPETLEHKAYGAYVVESASGAIASFDDGADSIPMKDVLVHIEPVQAGSGDPSPDNVRPITGWTGAKVMRTGKNLFGNWETTINGYIDSSGTIVSGQNDRIYVFEAKPNTTFTLRITRTPIASATDDAQVGEYYSESVPTVGSTGTRLVSGNYLSATNKITFTFTTSENTRWIAIKVFNVTKTDADAALSTCQLELGTTATDYEPYSGQTYDITFPSEAGTVYGGTLDVTNGVLTVDRAMVDIGSMVWTTHSSPDKHIFRAAYPTPAPKVPASTAVPANAISSCYAAIAYSPLSANDHGRFAIGNAKVVIINHDYSDASAFATAMTGQTICYELATPITYQLTPQEIASLLGQNNLWADTGDSEVEYRADTKMYIARQIASAVSALS